MANRPRKTNTYLQKRSDYANTPDVASKLSNCLAREMKRNEWTFEDLGKKLGTTKSQAHDWVKGTHEPNLSSIRHIAKVFGWDVAELIGAA